MRLQALIVHLVVVALVAGCQGKKVEPPAGENNQPSPGVLARDDALPSPPLAHFRFDGSAENRGTGNAKFELKNTQFKDESLYLNVIKDGAYTDGYRAVCVTPEINYETFTVVIRVKPEVFSNLITGGISYRWFGMQMSHTGELVITLNNQSFSKVIDKVRLENGKWATVACAVNVPGRKIIVLLNGVKAEQIDLPNDFELEVVKAKVDDKEWSFRNYSNANYFQGFVRELLVYDRVLSLYELEEISLQVQRAAQGKVKLIVAKKNIAQGMQIKNPEELFELREWPKGEAPMEYVTKFNDLKDRVLLLDIQGGRPVVLGMFYDKNKLKGLVDTDKKVRRIAITVNAAQTAGGFILPGSHVDIVHTVNFKGGSETKMILENVLVRAVDQQPVRPEDKPSSVPVTITLELSLEQAQKLIHLKSTGTLTVLVRPSGNTPGNENDLPKESAKPPQQPPKDPGSSG
jgi:pilus assembly protein CpaB